jgi:hypothetical protein
MNIHPTQQEIHAVGNVAAQLTAFRWSEVRANEWYEGNGWMVGCNYLPSTAINQLEMWQAETFDPFVIDKELTWAEELGFNTVRIFLHNLVWEQDPKSYLQRLDKFLDIAFKHGIKSMLVLFDSVWDPFPKPGKQPAPRPNIHNSRWVQCPGYYILNDCKRYDGLQGYVQGIVAHFKDDERVLLWDLFNEPDNMNLTSYKDKYYVQHKAELSMQLLKRAISWIRIIDPVQPVTMAPWQWVNMESLSVLDNFMFTHSDVISFHSYENKDGMTKRINSLNKFNRPVLCSEYMARPLGSTFEQILPLLRDNKVGALSWGFVQGKSQTHCSWDSWQINCQKEPQLWFHDILRNNGEPYDREEVEFLKEFNCKEPAEFQNVA